MNDNNSNVSNHMNKTKNNSVNNNIDNNRKCQYQTNAKNGDHFWEVYFVCDLLCLIH